MTPCDRIADRMPDVANGRARWSVGDEQHLADCASCGLEWVVVRGAARLGTEPELRVNEVAIADTVLHRLRTEPGVVPAITPDAAPRRHMWVFAGVAGAIAIAASLVLLIRTSPESARAPAGIAGRESASAETPVETGQLELPVPGLEDLSVAALDTVLRALDRPFRADEVLESNWSDVESREFEVGFSTISTSEE